MRSWLIPFPSHAGATQARTAFHCSGGSQKRAAGCALVPARNSPSPYRVLEDLGLPAIRSTMRTYYGQYRCWWPFLCSAACVRGTGVLYDALSPVHTTVQYTLHLPLISLPPCVPPTFGLFLISVRRSFAGACSVYAELGPADIPRCHRSLHRQTNEDSIQGNK